VCQKTLHVWNAGANKAVLFLNGPGSQCGGVGALPPIPAKFVKFGSNGQALQFDVPPTVLHPIGGLTVAVTDVTSTIKKQTATVKGKKVGYFESVAKTHPVQVTFVTEQGQTSNREDHREVADWFPSPAPRGVVRGAPVAPQVRCVVVDKRVRSHTGLTVP